LISGFRAVTSFTLALFLTVALSLFQLRARGLGGQKINDEPAVVNA
jgi:hypothetical protein